MTKARGARAAAKPRAADLYREPLLYDVLHTPGTARDVDMLVRLERRFARPPAGTPRLWLEPACGTGRHLRVAAARGIPALGFDASEPMIAFARERLARGPGAARARVFAADMTAFAAQVAPRSVTFAFNTINTIRHLADDAALALHFAEIARVLAPGGVYAVGIDLTLYGREPSETHFWEARRGGLRVTQEITYEPPARGRDGDRLEQVTSEIRVATAGRRERIRAHYALRTYDGAEWRAALARAGFSIEGVTDGSGRDAEPLPSIYRVFVLAPSPSRPSDESRR